MYQLSNPNQYSQQWEDESNTLEAQGVYQALAKLVPKERVLEIGCGVGNGTIHLAVGRDVLALDNNELLIAKASTRLKDTGHTAQIHHCDLFELSDEDLAVIKHFEPKVVAAWFIGSHGEDIFRRTPEHDDAGERSKVYRENIEDIVVSRAVTTESVEIINLVSRGGMVASCSAQEAFDVQKADYDEYVFDKIGFEVCDVKVAYWDRTGSTFVYGHADNPYFIGEETVPVIISIFARRKPR